MNIKRNPMTIATRAVYGSEASLKEDVCSGLFSGYGIIYATTVPQVYLLILPGFVGSLSYCGSTRYK